MVPYLSYHWTVIPMQRIEPESPSEVTRKLMAIFDRIYDLKEKEIKGRVTK